MVNVEDEADGMDFGAESSNEGEESHHSLDDDLTAPSTVNSTVPTDNTPDVSADTTTAHHPVAAHPTSEDTHDHADVTPDTHDHPDVPADTTTAHHLVAAPPTLGDELAVPELQEWPTKHAKQRSRHEARLSPLLEE